MRLVYLFNGRLPTEKAHGLQVAKMCEAFASNGLDVELLVAYRRNDIKESIFDYYHLKHNFLVKLVWGLDLSRWPVPGKLAFHVQSFVSALSLIFHALSFPKDVILYSRDARTVRILEMFGRRPVIEVHDYRLKKPKKSFFKSLSSAKKIIVNSSGTQKEILKHYSLPVEKFLVAPNGVDVDFFDVKEGESEARLELGLPHDKVIVTYVGRLETLGMEKGVSSLLEATKSFSDRGIFVCVVGGPNEMIENYNRSRADVIFTGQVKHELVPKYMRASDILVVPFPETRQFAVTASPIKLFEYLAAGKPIIASDLPAIREVLNEGNAVFFKAGDAEDLKDKISEVITDREKSKRIATNALIDSRQYDWLERAKKIMRFAFF